MKSLLSALAVLGTLATSGAAQAATITVNTLADDGPGNCATTCTLRDAVATAASGDLVLVDVSGTIVLDAVKGNLYINKHLFIRGRGPGETIISGNDAIRILTIEGTNAMRLVHLEGLSLVHGRSVGDSASGATPGSKSGLGGAIYAGKSAVLMLSHVALADNQAIGGNGGDAGADYGGGGGGWGGQGGRLGLAAWSGGPGGGGGGGLSGETASSQYNGGGGGLSNGGGGGAGVGGYSGSAGGAFSPSPSNSCTSPGCGGAAAPVGTGPGYGGGGGGSAVGGAVYLEGYSSQPAGDCCQTRLYMANVAFRNNEVRAGNGGAGSMYGGGGGGGGAYGWDVGHRFGWYFESSASSYENVTTEGGVAVAGNGGAPDPLYTGGAWGQTGVASTFPIYTGDFYWHQHLPVVSTAAVTVTAGPSQQLVRLQARVSVGQPINGPMLAVPTLTFTVKDASGNTIGTPAVAPVAAGNAVTTFTLTAKVPVRYTVWVSSSGTAYSAAPLDVVPLPFAVALRTESLAPGDLACPAGGARVQTGLDDGLPAGVARDGVLQDGEVDQTSNLCAGTPGATGATGATGANAHAVLTTVTPLDPGAACAAGGQTVAVGLDDGAGAGTPDDGLLHADEVDDSQTVCSGAGGNDGADGKNGADGEPGTDGAPGAKGKAGGGCASGGDALASVPAALALAWLRLRRSHAQARRG